MAIPVALPITIHRDYSVLVADGPVRIRRRKQMYAGRSIRKRLVLEYGPSTYTDINTIAALIRTEKGSAGVTTITPPGGVSYVGRYKGTITIRFESPTAVFLTVGFIGEEMS